MPFHRWPAGDRTLWLAGIAPATNPFDARGAGAAWSPRSCRKTASGYGRYLTWLEAQGCLSHDVLPEARVTRERVSAYVHALSLTRAPYTLVCRIQELCDALRVLAPRGDRSWLLRLLANLAARAVPVRDKRPRLRAAGELKELGLALMEEAVTAVNENPIERALKYRDGLMIALLAYRPIRVRAFSGLRIGQHLIRQDTGFMLKLSAADTKSRRPLEIALPDSLARAMTDYLEIHREVLLAAGQHTSGDVIDALWISKRGTAMTSRSVPGPIRKRTADAFGQPIPPHWFRDCTATTVALEDPKHVSDIRHLLDHTSRQTAERHYNQANGLEASRRFQALLDDLREQPT
jgi:site-specific recombinase XerC